MYSFEQIKELIELVADHGLQGLEIERSGYRLKITGKEPPPSETPAPSSVPVVASPQAPAVAAGTGRQVQPPPETASEAQEKETESEEDEIPEDAHVITSPIVGTFYRAPAPDSDPFVQVGDSVKKGQVLCIVEAMKLMNEIESEVSGEILEILPKDAQAVEYGEALFVIETD
ncbi:MAG: acetyl-CoA carboxylase biotin carboxyl carrier protein [Thermoanaerobaculia bacterium]|nr:acetyl-CoA carboxylase biotin carboxyl carrier protein [Thermoanaerobaculia bacterium]